MLWRGFFSVQDSVAQPPQENSESQDAPDEVQQDSDPLAKQQGKAAANLGLGNVSTLQQFEGSRVLVRGGLAFSCMGNELLCSSLSSGQTCWKLAIDGDMAEIGGHLGSTPIAAGKYVIFATTAGDIVELDPDSGRRSRLALRPARPSVLRRSRGSAAFTPVRKTGKSSASTPVTPRSTAGRCGAATLAGQA